MDKQFLNLIPKRYLCPYCGEWHEWNKTHELGYYDSSSYTAEFKCSNAPAGSNEGYYRIYFKDGKCYYSTEQMCRRASQNMSGNIAISSFIESTDEPIVTFDVEFTSSSDVGRNICRNCSYVNMCNCVKLGDKGDNRHMKITFGFMFEQSDYDKISKAMYFARKEKKLKERENALNSREEELAALEQSVTEAKERTLQQQEKVQEESTMANIFNTSMEFGPNKDENIVSTLMGVAVKNGDNWRIYDKKKKEITDVGDIQLGNLPIFILPTTKLAEGDLIKDAGEYYFVMKVEAGSTQTLCAKTGEMKTVIPIKNVLGFSCYSKIIALSDSVNMGDDFDVEKLAIMSAMCGQPAEGKNASMNQLLPLMLFKDNMGGDDDMMKMILLSSMMGTQNEVGEQNASMNQLLPLMLISKKDTGNDDMTKMLLVSSMMGGSNGSNNLIMSYLMMDIMGKKEKKADELPDSQE